MTNEEPLLTVAEVAAIVRAHPVRVYAMCADGTIPAIRIGKRVRIPRAAFSRWLEALNEQALAGTIAAPGRRIETGTALASA